MANVSNYIYIYRGAGTDKFCAEATKRSLYQIIPNAQQRIIEIEDPSLLESQGCLTQRNLLIIPGGYSFQIQGGFSSALMEKIQKAVEANTVSYFGICAGAYAGSCNSNMRLTPSICWTPRDKIIYAVKAVPISCVSGETFHIVRWGGGYYGKIDPSETPVAYYESSKDIAILQPRQNVVLSNVHPELQLNIPYVRQHLPLHDDAALQLLAKSSPCQQKLLIDILTLLDIKASKPEQSPALEDESSPEVDETHSYWEGRSVVQLDSSVAIFNLFRQARKVVQVIAVKVIRQNKLFWRRCVVPHIRYSLFELVVKNRAIDALRTYVNNFLEFNAAIFKGNRINYSHLGRFFCQDE